MKKFVSLILGTILVLTLTACGKSNFDEVKKDEEVLQEDYVKNEEIGQKPTISSGQGISTESQTEEKVDNSVKQEK